MARLYSHEFPAAGAGVSALQAVENASHCQCPNPLQQNPQTGRQKGKGRVCLGEEGDSKEEDKGKEEIRGVACMQYWSDGSWEEPRKPMAHRGGREYAKEVKSLELTEG